MLLYVVIYIYKLIYCLSAGNRSEKRSYLEYCQSRALHFFTNAARVGNYLTGFVMRVKSEGKFALALTDNCQQVKSFVVTRKAVKLKFIRPNSTSNISPVTNTNVPEDISFKNNNDLAESKDATEISFMG